MSPGPIVAHKRKKIALVTGQLLDSSTYYFHNVNSTYLHANFMKNVGLETAKGNKSNVQDD